VTTAERLGWIVRDDGPADADHAVLLLPGALATPAFYDDLLAEPTIGSASIRFVAGIGFFTTNDMYVDFVRGSEGWR